MMQQDMKKTATLPSLVDLHVHFREPGYSYKETIRTGSLAAAAGGFTTVCTMPNLNPVPDSPDNLRVQQEIIDRDAVIQVLPFAAITRGRLGKEVVDFAALAPYVAGFSDDGTGVQDDDVMRRAMEQIAATGKILAAHCEVERLLNGGYVHDSALLRSHGHRGICSESEWGEVGRDIRLAEETGCRLHICHVSTKESVDLIRAAKSRGVNVTAETAPHYLVFCDEDIPLDEESDNSRIGRFKMNPPLRCAADREALREAVADGTIDVIATDHAPHSAEEKSRGLARSAMGIIGLETAFAAVYTSMVLTGRMPMERLVDAMALRPRQILGIPYNESDRIQVDLEQEFKVDPSTFNTLGRATPFEGMTLRGKIISTVYDGKEVYKTD